ncbi:Protein of unknown function (DUF4012) [Actinobacteria bacterium IMCC26256]|nr:Protein of unknown function (DUF4012) [Actinobacteria bacterium IMCC26256]
MVLVFMLCWIAGAAANLLSARSKAQAGITRLESAQGSLSAADVLRGEGLVEIRAANRDFTSAAHSSGSFFLAPFEVLPIIGRQLHSVQALAAAAASITQIGAGVTESAQRAVAVPAVGGPERVALVESLGKIAERASTDLNRVDLGPGNALVSPLAKARTRFVTQVDRIRQATSDLQVASGGLAAIMKGPTRYLVFAASNAEMRSGSGAWLTAGVLTFDGGRFSLSEMRSSVVYNPSTQQSPVPADFAKQWGWAEIGTDFRNLSLTPNFPDSAAVAVSMWRQSTGQEVDGVIVLDPIALRSLLEASGPVDVDGRQISRENVAQYLLIEQYRGLDYDLKNPERTEEMNAARRAGLSRVANAIVERLDAQGWDAPDLVESLRVAAAGRHVLAWAGNAEQERAWIASGIDGRVPSDALSISVINVGANKLDVYLDTKAKVRSVSVLAKGTSQNKRVKVAISISNNTPTGLGRYAAGPFPGKPYAEGEYAGILALNVPRNASRIRLSGVDAPVARGPEGAATVVAGSFRVLRDSSRDFVLSFEVPDASSKISVRPSARVPATLWSYRGVEWRDEESQSIAP